VKFRYKIRRRCCSSIPVLICELFVPMLMIGLIICFSHFLLNNSLFESNKNTRCSQNPSEDSSKDNYLQMNCLNIENDLFKQNSSKRNLIVRYLNNSNENILFEKFVERIKSSLNENDCSVTSQMNVLLWENLSSEDRTDLFSCKTCLNILIHIYYFFPKQFSYEIIVEMPSNDLFEQKLKVGIDNSFEQRHQHPSEQIVDL
jgi:hypothetical protein